MNATTKTKSSTKAASTFQWIIIILAACLVYGVMQGIHDNYGIMMRGLLVDTGIDYAGISFCIGVGALVYGFAQPLLGMLALKKSNTFVLMIGIICTISGLVVSPLCRSFFSLLLFFGLLLPFGTAGLCFGIIMGAITPIVGEKRAAMFSGIIQASAGIGDALMSPGLQTLIASFGIRTAMSSFSIPFLIMIPIALWIGHLNRTLPKSAAAPGKEHLPLTHIISSAFRDRDYRLILIGFSTCGFNMSIIESHLFSQFISYGIPDRAASFALTVYGIATMVGAASIGFLGMKLPMKNLLGGVYGIRVFISLGFLFLPKSIAFAFIMTALLGMSGDSTVPPTSGIISRKFGSKNMAMLYGFALVGHQVGAFFSAYLGGLFVKNGWGYEPLWIVNMCLAAMASIASFSIRKENEAVSL